MVTDNTPTQDALRIVGDWRSAPSGDDAAAITNLLQVYALYTDGGLVGELATLFTPDAEWDGSALGYGTARGRDPIAQHVAGRFDPTRPMVHLPGPPVLVQRDADTVEAVSWTVATRLADGVTRPLIHFSYTDLIARSDEGWKFARRVLRPTLPTG